MNLNYYAMNPWEKFIYRLTSFFKGFGRRLGGFFVAIWKGIVSFFRGLYAVGRNYVSGFCDGNATTKLSYAVMGFGHFTRGQIVRGLIYLLIEVAFAVYMIFLDGWFYLSSFFKAIFTGGQFGYKVYTEGWDDNVGDYVMISEGDNSFLFLLYGVVAVLMVCAFLVIYYASVRESYKNEQDRAIGLKLATFKDNVRELFDRKIHVSLLTIPLLGVVVFTVVPLIAMILIAFTNYDRNTPINTTLFSWVGLDNFKELFTTFGSENGLGYTFLHILLWTVIWAFFATFTNYFGGMLLAMLINKKGIRLKKFWRTVFVITIAVPQFVSLLIMSLMLFSADGVDTQNVGIITSWIEKLPGDFFFNFSNNALHTRIGVIIVNMWIGVPYTMLMCSGILMNIPADLYESARIDGASPARRFMKITLPYMLFVTGPYLITQFIGNLNNFNVIYLLSAGGPALPDYDPTAKGADLLVTWLYRLTSENQDYKLAAIIGILTFVISAVFSLVVYNKSSAVKGEENFQ